MAGSGRFNGEMVNWLAKQGHTIDVITAHPYYPEWEVWTDYKGKGWFKEVQDRVTIYRTPLYVPKTVSGKGRILHELSFVGASLVHWMTLLFTKYDVMIAVCPPMQIGLLPLFIGWLKRTPFFFHIQDLQVDAARELGMVKNKTLLRILDFTERFLLRHATIVSSISEGMKARILGKGVKPEQYFMLPNWADISFLRPLPPNQLIKDSLGVKPNEKIVLYSGNIGEKQGIEVVLEAAKICQQRGYDYIKFVISGEGAALNTLVLKTEEYQLTNLLFSPIRPFAELPDLLSIADVHLVIQKKAASDLVLPSKLVSILSVGGIAVVTAEASSTLDKLITTHQMGWVVEPENPEALLEGIQQVLNNGPAYNIKANARRFAEENLDKENILRKLERLLLSYSN